ncbi:CopD family protein [Devosia sp.]|uniref:CopD family protein n=1 Tax=Devosia sp. TaxID=1871048 RepID=UPI003F725D75
MDTDSALVLARWGYFLSVMILFGSALFPFHTLEKTASASRATLPRRANFSLALSAVVFAAVWLLLFVAGLADRESMVETLRYVLLESAFGPVWIARLSLALLLLAASLWGRPGLIVAPAFLMLICEGWQGHAATWDVAGSLNQAIHVASAGAWIGGLLPLGLLLAAARRNPSDVAGVESALWRFSRFGVAAVALIAITGAVNTWWMLGGVPDLSDTYGRVLLLKISLFAAMVGLALYNRSLIARMKADPARGLRTLSRNVVLEQMVGFAVLLDVSALGLMSPNA